MSWTRYLAAVALCTALGACVAADEGAPLDSGGAVSEPPAPPSGDSPAATAQEMLDYLYDGSVEVSWYGDGEILYQIDCGFVDGSGRYEAEALETDPDGYYSYDWWYPGDGTWLVQGNQLCVDATYYDPDTGEAWPTSGCYAAEWSLDDTLLLIDGRDQITAEIFAWDGRERYLDGCGL